MSMLLRAAPLRAARSAAQPLRQQTRGVHFENVVDHALPTDVKNKGFLAFKMTAYAITGFGLPFFASWYHIQKAAGGN